MAPESRSTETNPSALTVQGRVGRLPRPERRTPPDHSPPLRQSWMNRSRGPGSELALSLNWIISRSPTIHPVWAVNAEALIGCNRLVSRCVISLAGLTPDVEVVVRPSAAHP